MKKGTKALIATLGISLVGLVGLSFLLGCMPYKDLKKVHILDCSVNIQLPTDEPSEEFVPVDYCQETSYLIEHVSRILKNSHDVSRTSLTYSKATRINILNEIQRIPPDTDLVIIYIGSHGTNREGFYEICLADGRFLRGSELIHAIHRKGIQTLLILDTCHAGAIMRDLDRLPSNLSIIAASSEQSSSYCWALTYSLIHGLESGADYDNNRQVTIRELQMYCILNTVRFQGVKGKPQEIIHWGESDYILVGY